MPSKREAITSNQRPLPLLTRAMAATRDSAARPMLRAWRSLLCIQAGVSSQPCSLPMATIEPLKVIAPTNTETTMEMASTSEPLPSPLLPTSG